MIEKISKNQIKYVRSLSILKYRKEHQCYIVEGRKNAEEWLRQGASIEMVIGLPEWFDENKTLHKGLPQNKLFLADEIDFEKISTLKTPNQVMLVVKVSPQESIDELQVQSWMLILDKVQDPGNLGTIIRTADWFGIKTIICSEDTVEWHNPKVIQSTMGSLLRVKGYYTDLTRFLTNQAAIPSYAAVLGGSSLEEITIAEPGFIIMGNESKGISPEVQNLVKNKLTIPRIGDAESLNVAVATGIFCHALIGS